VGVEAKFAAHGIKNIFEGKTIQEKAKKTTDKQSMKVPCTPATRIRQVF
jgi:hypothetical protein